MVYKIFDDHHSGGNRRNRRNKTRRSQFELPTIRIKSKSLIANVLIVSIQTLLFLYDTITLPIYYLIQLLYLDARQPFGGNNVAHRSEQVDANTWMRTGEQRRAYLGSTLGEIFANSIQRYHSRPCLGYRALVTCPVMVVDEDGRHLLQEKSFRSDFTWYTYGQIGRRVQDIASGLYAHSIYPTTSRALFLASTCLEWLCSAQACFQLGVQLVLAPDISDKRALHLVACEAEIDVIFVTCDRLKQLCSLLDTIKLSHLEGPQIKRIIIIDWQFSVDFSERIFTQLGESASGCLAGQPEGSVLSMSQIEEAGIENPIELCCSRALSDEQLELGSIVVEANSFGRKAGLIPVTPYDQSGPMRKISEGGERPLVGRRSGRRPLTPNTLAGPRPLAADLNGSDIRLSQTAPPVRRRRRRRRSIREAPPMSCATNAEEHQQPTAPSNTCPDSRATSRSARGPSSRPDDLAMIVYTYGLLGQMKPIMLTQGQLVRASQQLFADQLVDVGDLHCATISLDNIIEFTTEFCMLSHGGSIGYSNNLETLFYDGRELFKRDKSDLEALGPSFLLAKPYVLERLRVSVYSYLQMHVNPLAGFIMKNILVDYKRHWCSPSPSSSPSKWWWRRRPMGTPLVDWLFCSKLTSLFGPRMRYILCHGATDCSETRDFFAHMVNLPIVELYGPDEAPVSMMSVAWGRSGHQASKQRSRRKRSMRRPSAGKRRPNGCVFRLFDGGQQDEESQEDQEDLQTGPTTDYANVQLMPPTVNRNTTFRENKSRNLLVGQSIRYVPTLGTRIRLEDWQEFGAQDAPHPRGRLVLGGQTNVCVAAGYFKRPQLTGEHFYCDSGQLMSWFRTDQLVRVLPDGSLELISAISDLVRMANSGQFVSLSQIERVLKDSRFVDNCCAICGDDDQCTFVLNLIVPNLRHLALKSPGEASLKPVAALGPLEPEPEELTNLEFRREVCNDRLMCEFLAEHLAKLLAGAGLSPAEVPMRFLLVPEFWTPESELVTPAMEPKRAAIQRYYATDIQSIVRWQRRAPSRLPVGGRPFGGLGLGLGQSRPRA